MDISFWRPCSSHYGHPWPTGLYGEAPPPLHTNSMYQHTRPVTSYQRPWGNPLLPEASVSSPSTRNNKPQFSEAQRKSGLHGYTGACCGVCRLPFRSDFGAPSLKHVGRSASAAREDSPVGSGASGGTPWQAASAGKQVGAQEVLASGNRCRVPGLSLREGAGERQG